MEFSSVKECVTNKTDMKCFVKREIHISVCSQWLDEFCSRLHIS